MAISFTKYIDIISGIIGANQTGARSLGLRVFSTNPLIPSNTFATFTNSNDVGAYFGTTSTEYLISVFYFGFISKMIKSPASIDFSSWVQTAVTPTIYGASNATATLAQFNAITAGRLNLTLGVTTQELTAINLSGAANLAAVATIIQTAINTVTADPEWHTATVTYDATRAAFKLTGGVAQASPVSVAPASTGIDVGVSLGWENINTIISAGSGAVTLTNALIASSQASNNFGTFSFIPTLNQAQVTEVATWLSGTNVQYIFLTRVSAANASAISAAIIGLPGVCMTLDGVIAGQFPSLLPGAVLGATDYTIANAVQNFMYQQDPALTPNVSDDTSSAAYDALRVNYYGVTQTNGKMIAFYQRGFLTGGVTAPTDIGVYANEMWLKSAIADAWFNALLALNQIPANSSGRATALTIIKSVIAVALTNGTISVGNDPLTVIQQAAITQDSGTSTAWQQVQNTGWWLNVTFSSFLNTSNATEYQANYTLIYAKNNSIRKVNGTHDLV